MNPKDILIIATSIYFLTRKPEEPDPLPMREAHLPIETGTPTFNHIIPHVRLQPMWP
jgi:hypothetical protein